MVTQHDLGVMTLLPRMSAAATLSRGPTWFDRSDQTAGMLAAWVSLTRAWDDEMDNAATSRQPNSGHMVARVTMSRRSVRTWVNPSAAN